MSRMQSGFSGAVKCIECGCDPASREPDEVLAASVVRQRRQYHWGTAPIGVRRFGSYSRSWRLNPVAYSLPLRYLNVGEQHAHSSGGQPCHGFEERACFRRGDGGARGGIVGVVEVDHAVCGRGTAVFSWPYLRCLKPYISGDLSGGLELFGTECGFEGLGIGRVVVDDGDFVSDIDLPPRRRPNSR